MTKLRLIDFLIDRLKRYFEKSMLIKIAVLTTTGLLFIYLHFLYLFLLSIIMFLLLKYWLEVLRIL